jgi:hypothetical protein
MHFRTMSDSPSCHAIEKCTKKSQDVGGSSSQVKKPCARKVILCVPPPIPLEEEEDELPFQVHSPVEDPSSHRTQVNYMREDSRMIINQRHIHAMSLQKSAQIIVFGPTSMRIGINQSIGTSRLPWCPCSGQVGLF